jgi:hypothetical protein
MASGEIRTRTCMNCRKTAYIVTRTATHSRTLLALDQDFGGWLKEFKGASRARVERVGFRLVELRAHDKEHGRDLYVHVEQLVALVFSDYTFVDIIRRPGRCPCGYGL